MQGVKVVYETEPLFRRFRPGSLKYGESAKPIITSDLALLKADFLSEHYPCLTPQDREVIENRQFAYPVFLPSLRGTFRDAVIILNGLNESDYRKFFPWALTLAANGIPALVFPIAFLLNRRPRSWFAPRALRSKLEARRKREGNRTCTLYNALLSERLDESPERFFLAGLMTYLDLLDLVRDIYSGGYALSYGREVVRPFGEGTTTHFLGYSLGGYLSLILLLSRGGDEALRESAVNIFCSGSALRGGSAGSGESVSGAANPESPLILDRAASERLAEFYGSGASYPFMDTPEAGAFRAVFLPACGLPSAEMRVLRPRMNVIASQNDLVIPIEGVRDNLGWVDLVISTGAHEYPFNIRSVREPNMERRMARAYDVASEWRPAFAEFMDSVVRSVGGA